MPLHVARLEAGQELFLATTPNHPRMSSPQSARGIPALSQLLLACSLFGMGACTERVSVPSGPKRSLSATQYAERAIADGALRQAAFATVGTAVPCAISDINAAVVQDSQVFLLSEGKLSVWRGDTLAVVARNGGGPFELRAPIAMGDAPDGAVTVFDIGKMRMLDFTGDGGRREAVLFPPNCFRSPLVRNGRVFAYTLPPAAALGDTVTAAIVGFVGADSAWSDTLAVLPEPATSVIGEGGASLSRLPWDRTLLWDVCTDGEAVVGYSDQWQVSWFRKGKASGDVYSVAVPTVGSVPMSDAEHASLSAEWLEKSPKLPSFRAALQERLARKPATRPALQAIYCGAGNSAFLVRTPDFGATTQIIDHVGRDGALLSSVRVSSNVQIVGVAGAALVGILRGESGDIVHVIDVPRTSK